MHHAAVQEVGREEPPVLTLHHDLVLHRTSRRACVGVSGSVGERAGGRVDGFDAVAEL